MGSEVLAFDEAGLRRAVRKYQQFTAKKAENFEGLLVPWPDRVAHMGRAVRSEYISDKWHPDGEVVHYYHDHDSGTVEAFGPAGAHAWAREVPVVGDWPREAWMLGLCLSVTVERHDTDERVELSWPWLDHLPVPRVGWAEAQERGLPAWIGWPHGHVLAVLHPVDGVLCVVSGPKLRVTEAGIEG
jgi:hypothetical protein